MSLQEKGNDNDKVQEAMFATAQDRDVIGFKVTVMSGANVEAPNAAGWTVSRQSRGWNVGCQLTMTQWILFPSVSFLPSLNTSTNDEWKTPGDLPAPWTRCTKLPP